MGRIGEMGIEHREQPNPPVAVGVDVGKQRDPATICVVSAEPVRFTGLRWRLHWTIRSLERLELGTTYPAVADRITQVVGRIRDVNTRPPQHVFIDATGVGGAVCDLLSERKTRHTPCVFIAGETRTEHFKDDSMGLVRVGKEVERVTIGKLYAVGRVVGILESERLTMDPGPAWDALKKELLAFEVTPGALHDRYGAESGAHDDLVTALALAMQIDLRPAVRPRRVRLGNDNNARPHHRLHATPRPRFSTG